MFFRVPSNTTLPPSTSTHAFPFRWWEFVWYLLIMLVGCVGNLLVILVIVLNKRIELTSTFNMHVSLLAVADLFVSMVGLPIYYLSTDAFNHPAGIRGDQLCSLFTGYFLPFFLLDISVFALVLIALGRRKAIIHPYSVLSEESVTRKTIPIATVVFISLALGVPTIYGLKYSPTDPIVGNHCTYRYTFIQSIIIYCVVFSVDTIVPIVVLVTCFRQISKSLARTNKFLRNSIAVNQSTINKRKDAAMKQKQKSIATMRLVVLAFFVCILPNHLLYLASLAGVNGLAWDTDISQVGVLVRFTNSCVNPLLYSFMSQKFRKNLKSTFPVFFKARKPKIIYNKRNLFPRNDGYVAIKENEQYSASSNIF